MGARGTDIATTETPASSRRPKLSVAAPADPGFAALRRAARAALVIPPVLAFISPPALRAAALDCLRGWRNDEGAGRGALAVLMAVEWTQNLARLEEDLKEPMARAADAARTPWRR